MAQRLATEYVKTCLELSESEMNRFIQLFASLQTHLQVKVLEGGNQELTVQDEAGAEVVLSFDRVAGKYVCTGSCKVCSPKLANALRKAVSEFKGNALVNRYYNGFTMVYLYERGTVVRIVEKKGARENVIYEYKDTVGKLEQLFRKNEIEHEIRQLHAQVDVLLDTRNEAGSDDRRKEIDASLRALTKRMFELEV